MGTDRQLDPLKWPMGGSTSRNAVSLQPVKTNIGPVAQLDRAAAF
jgi:hypothetical protein